MGVFKEHAIAFESVAKRQSRIYNDAADFGVAYNTKNPPADIKNLIHYANDLKGTSLQQSRTEYHLGVEIVFHIGWEIDEGMECGTEYKINFCKISGSSRLDKSADGMISVAIRSYRKPYKRRSFTNH